MIFGSSSWLFVRGLSESQGSERGRERGCAESDEEEGGRRREDADDASERTSKQEEEPKIRLLTSPDKAFLLQTSKLNLYHPIPRL